MAHSVQEMTKAPGRSPSVEESAYAVAVASKKKLRGMSMISDTSINLL